MTNTIKADHKAALRWLRDNDITFTQQWVYNYPFARPSWMIEPLQPVPIILLSKLVIDYDNLVISTFNHRNVIEVLYNHRYYLANYTRQMSTI